MGEPYVAAGRGTRSNAGMREQDTGDYVELNRQYWDQAAAAVPRPPARGRWSAPGTSRPGWPGRAPARSVSACRPGSSPPREPCKPSSASSSACCSPMPSGSPAGTTPSTWRSASTGPRCGATPTSGSRRPRLLVPGGRAAARAPVTAVRALRTARRTGAAGAGPAAVRAEPAGPRQRRGVLPAAPASCSGWCGRAVSASRT